MIHVFVNQIKGSLLWCNIPLFYVYLFYVFFFVLGKRVFPGFENPARFCEIPAQDFSLSGKRKMRVRR